MTHKFSAFTLLLVAALAFQSGPTLATPAVNNPKAAALDATDPVQLGAFIVALVAPPADSTFAAGPVSEDRYETIRKGLTFNVAPGAVSMNHAALRSVADFEARHGLLAATNLWGSLKGGDYADYTFAHAQLSRQRDLIRSCATTQCVELAGRIAEHLTQDGKTLSAADLPLQVIFWLEASQQERASGAVTTATPPTSRQDYRSLRKRLGLDWSPRRTGDQILQQLTAGDRLEREFGPVAASLLFTPLVRNDFQAYQEATQELARIPAQERACTGPRPALPLCAGLQGRLELD